MLLTLPFDRYEHTRISVRHIIQCDLTAGIAHAFRCLLGLEG
ncbi:MAG: hypothetical protein WA137_05690 [Methanothrix sp.]